MGWRERDWAKFTDEEFAAIYGAAARRATGRAATAVRGRTRRRRTFGVIGVCVLGVAATVAVLAYQDHLPEWVGTPAASLPAPRGSLASPTPQRARVPAPATVATPAPPPLNVIGIRWRASDLAPAANAGRICVTPSRHGRICASFVVGERPADTLTRELGRRGLKVESAGGG